MHKFCYTFLTDKTKQFLPIYNCLTRKRLKKKKKKSFLVLLKTMFINISFYIHMYGKYNIVSFRCCIFFKDLVVPKLILFFCSYRNQPH